MVSKLGLRARGGKLGIPEGVDGGDGIVAIKSRACCAWWVGVSACFYEDSWGLFQPLLWGMNLSVGLSAWVGVF